MLVRKRKKESMSYKTMIVPEFPLMKPQVALSRFACSRGPGVIVAAVAAIAFTMLETILMVVA